MSSEIEKLIRSLQKMEECYKPYADKGNNKIQHDIGHAKNAVSLLRDALKELSGIGRVVRIVHNGRWQGEFGYLIPGVAYGFYTVRMFSTGVELAIKREEFTYLQAED